MLSHGLTHHFRKSIIKLDRTWEIDCLLIKYYMFDLSVHSFMIFILIIIFKSYKKYILVI